MRGFGGVHVLGSGGGKQFENEGQKTLHVAWLNDISFSRPKAPGAWQRHVCFS